MDFSNVVSVDELLDYFFQFGFKPEFDEHEIRNGMASDENVVEFFQRVFDRLGDWRRHQSNIGRSHSRTFISVS